MLEREYKGHETARLAIEKLSPKDGDIIVITFPEDILREQMQQFAEELTASIHEANPEVKITVMCMKGGMKASFISEEYLNEAGYFRKTEDEVTEH